MENNLPQEIDLRKVTAYAVYGTNDDKGTKLLCGYYSNASDAHIGAKGKGYFSDGEVVSEEIYLDKANCAYKVERIGKFLDVTERERNYYIQSIKNKLTPEELKILGIQ